MNFAQLSFLVDRLLRYLRFGFMIPQKITCWMITTMATTPIETQNPIFNPSSSVVPNRAIQIVVQFIVWFLLYSSSP